MCAPILSVCRASKTFVCKRGTACTARGHRFLAAFLLSIPFFPPPTHPHQGTNRFSAEDDAWGYQKASGITVTGRVVLNLWRLMRHELALTSYSFENIAYHILHVRVPRYTWAKLTEWYRCVRTQRRFAVSRACGCVCPFGGLTCDFALDFVRR